MRIPEWAAACGLIAFSCGVTNREKGDNGNPLTFVRPGGVPGNLAAFSRKSGRAGAHERLGADVSGTEREAAVKIRVTTGQNVELSLVKCKLLPLLTVVAFEQFDNNIYIVAFTFQLTASTKISWSSVNTKNKMS